MGAAKPRRRVESLPLTRFFSRLVTLPPSKSTLVTSIRVNLLNLDLNDIDAGRQFDPLLLKPHRQVINLRCFARGFLSRHLAEGELFLPTMPTEMDAVSSAPLLNCSHRCGSNITATLCPICSHSGQIGMFRFAVSI